MVNVGVFGGTFDPVHNGHLAIGREARGKLGLSYVIFVPAGNPWLKSDLPVTPSERRYEMVRLAVEPYPYLRMSRSEVDRVGPSYTVDTIAELKAGLSTEDRLFLLMGWDSLAQLPRWHQASRLVALCQVVAVPRPGYALPDLEALEKQIPGVSRSVMLLDMPQMDISASDIRSRIARGLSIRGLVPETVEKYIRENGLYREGR